MSELLSTWRSRQHPENSWHCWQHCLALLCGREMLNWPNQSIFVAWEGMEFCWVVLSGKLKVANCFKKDFWVKRLLSSQFTFAHLNPGRWAFNGCSTNISKSASASFEPHDGSKTTGAFNILKFFQKYRFSKGFKIHWSYFSIFGLTFDEAPTIEGSIFSSEFSSRHPFVNAHNNVPGSYYS